MSSQVVKIDPEIWDWWLGKIQDSKHTTEITKQGDRTLYRHQVVSKYKMETRYFWVDPKNFTQEVVQEDVVLLYAVRDGFTPQQEQTVRMLGATYQWTNYKVDENGEVIATSERGFNVTISKEGVVFWD